MLVWLWRFLLNLATDNINLYYFIDILKHFILCLFQICRNISDIQNVHRLALHQRPISITKWVGKFLPLLYFWKSLSKLRIFSLLKFYQDSPVKLSGRRIFWRDWLCFWQLIQHNAVPGHSYQGNQGLSVSRTSQQVRRERCIRIGRSRIPHLTEQYHISCSILWAMLQLTMRQLHWSSKDGPNRSTLDIFE